MDSRLERLLLDLKADRVSREYVKQYLKNRQGQTGPSAAAPDTAPPTELLRCHPVWRAADGPATGRRPGHVVLLAGPPELEHALRRQDATIDVRLLRSVATGLADRYADLAGQVLTALRSLAGDPNLPSTLVQLVCSLRGEDTLLSGLIGMIRSAGLENPGIVPQLLLVDPAAGAEPTALRILASRERDDDRVVRFRDGVREVLTWHELPAPGHTALPWREGGTYVVTGGLGGLGLIFARDLLRSVRNTSVLLSGRSALDGDRRHLLEGLSRPHARVEYTRLDVADPEAVEAYLAGVRREHGAIHGIIHSAGVLRDGFVTHKSAEELREVLAPKTAGTLNLDAAGKDDALDFFALFSSTAAVTGNVGQCDYAAANAFLDAFAHHRGELVAQGLRSGRSLSLNWPLWAEGGMRVDPETEHALREQTGMHALRTESGIRVFHESLASDHCQMMAVEGDGPRIRRTLLQQTATITSAPAPTPVPAVADDIDDEALRDRIVRRLGQMFGAVTGLPAAKIDPKVSLSTYGIDSIVVTRLNRKLADVFPDLPKTLLYEFNSLDALSRHLLRAHRQGCLDWTGTEKPRQAPAAPRPTAASAAEGQSPATATATATVAATERREPAAASPTEDAVAVIGMSGRFPMARNLREFWENLATGRDCVTEIPEDRWPLEGFYHPDRDEAVAAGLSYGKWGGFLDGFDEFDPLFFAISPQEAMSMDPQERLFLQESWNALEDAGYTRQRLADAHRRKVGVFAGVSKTGFDLYGPELWKRNEKLHPLTSFASVANRVSYLLDLTGPSLPVDTLCSSSLSAVHEAIQHLCRGECDLAVAGGVNLYLHPSNYTLMSGKRMLSDDGRCRSFGAGGNGFVPGEGVAVVLLKRLSDAERDNDNIRAVLRGSSVNHGGRTNGYTVPSPVAQAEVVREALARAGVSAGEVSFVEAHGTGTELGDPIEIDGLTQAFASDTGSRQQCAIGSLKSNIGHLEAAAGIAGLLKVVLQLEHGSIAAGLHAQEVNSNIDFTRTPFRLQRETTAWTRPAIVDRDGGTTQGDRIAGVSSFGAGGSNAHVVVAEYRRADPAPAPATEDAPWLIVLSAKDTERLRERARDLLDRLNSQDPATLDLSALAHTLQLGREAMDARLALPVGSHAELTGKLAAFVAGQEDIEDLHLGHVKEHREALTALGDDGDMATTVDLWIEKGKFDRLLGLWVKGLSVDWGKLYGPRRPRMLSLPGYPFARERYWVGDLIAEPGPAGHAAPGRLHPLVHTNTSTLDAQRFGSVFSGEESFLTDHVVGGRKVLPAAAYLEMARAALDSSLDGHTGRTVLRNVGWAQPLTVAGNAVHLVTTLYAAQDGPAREAAFEISGIPDGDPGAQGVVHSRGTVRALAGAGEQAAVDVAALREACRAERLDAEECYRVYRAMGLDYGPAHRGVESVATGDGQALARLRLPSRATADADGYVLHPSLLDAALQSTIGLFGRGGDDADATPATLHLPFALDELDVLGPCTPQMWAWVRYGEDDRPDLGVRKLDIDLLDDDGVPRCRLRGLTSRAYTANRSAERAGDTVPHHEEAAPAVAAPRDGASPPTGTLEERACRYLVGFLASELRVPAERIDPDDALEQYGIDSIMAMNLTNRLEGVFGSLSKTLFYEYQTISALSGYFLGAHRGRLAQLLAAQDQQEPSRTPADAVAHRDAAGSGNVRRTITPRGRRAPVARDTEIAVIGLAGRYPQARNTREFWRNLAEGRDSVTEIPADRWDHGPYFDPDKNAPGKTYTKWGGFLDGVDRFDSLFFNISPREAAFMDPQERLFLECVHETLEDAGYTREKLSRCDARGLPGNVGVFVGVMYEEYQLYGAQEQARGRNVTLSGSASTIANRVSYVFDLHGPSLAVDTMCSSSLTALHLACQSLRTGGCEAAVAGGVNLSLHPNKFLMLGSGKYASSKGRCESFGQGGDGYVPGEGVGAVLLKPLARAREDGDTVYGVIRATSVNHGGKTNGYSVPNPRAQYNVIGHALREAGIDAGEVSYVEAHGTGTSLGDPIEISALTSAFREYTDRTQFCAIGSVKSNIGHAESAAGIAALTKVLLQMKHGHIAPSLHSEVLNPHIDFDGSPFHVARELTPWSRPTGADGTVTPRIAGISSFGAGGSNAHVIVEEYQPAPRPADGRPAGGPAVVVLSARTDAGLRAQAEQLLRWTTEDEGATAELADIAHTLQSGREAYEERLGLVAATTGELAAKLRAFLDGESGVTDVYRGRAERRQGTSGALDADANPTPTLDAALARRAYGEVVRLWTTGLVVDWTKLHDERASAPRRISVPTYPFQGERHWPAAGTAAHQDRGAGPARLHPLLHTNTSTLQGQRFTSVYSGQEFFLRDHRVGGRPVLSGAACLELARAAVAASLDEPYRVAKIGNVAWTRPLTLHEPGLTVQVRLRPREADEVGFEILVPGDPAAGTADVIHCEGVVHVSPQPATPNGGPRVDLSRLREECRTPGPDADALYATAEARGIGYGPGHRGVQRLWTGAGQVLARIALPPAVRDTQDAYELHPSTLDAGLQACAGLHSQASGEELLLPFAVDEVEIFGTCPPEAWAWLRDGAGREGDGTRRVDVDLCDDGGRVCLRLKGVALRAHTAATTPRELFAVPHWVTADPAPATAPVPEGLVLVVDLPDVAAALEARDTARVVRLASSATDVGRRYTEHALRVFEEVKRLLGEPAHHPVRVQLVAPAVEASLWTGLAAVLRSAGLENPRLLGQLVLVAPQDAPERAASRVTADRAALADFGVRYLGGLRQVLKWREEDVDRRTAVPPWKDGGVYLITGGAGGLGSVFARDIAQRAHGARIVIAGRAPRDVGKDALLERLREHGAQTVYVQADVAVRDDVVRLVRETRQRYGRIDGILHAAGFTSDAFVIRKDGDEFSRVLAPKVAGLVHLDEATRDADLDFLVAFSSVAGALGNVGQADYAAANAFMDAFAAHRNALAARGERRGRTLSVAWPLWADGGMGVDAPTERSLRERFGLVPLLDEDGVRALYSALASPSDQVMVFSGDRPRIARTLLAGLLVDGPAPRPLSSPGPAVEIPDGSRETAPAEAGGLDETTAQQAVAYFKRLLAGVIDLPADRIDAEAPLDDYGVDSVMTMEMTRTLEEVFGSLPKTLFFEHRTITALTRHLLRTRPRQVAELLPPGAGARRIPAVAPGAPERPALGAERTWPVPSAQPAGRTDGLGPVTATGDIAIIGLAGRYPQARDVREFWRNLAAGKDCVTEVPGERWDHRHFFDPRKGAPGKSYSKWGGFLDGVYDFDPQFFNISPREAEIMDPQERLFLQCVHDTLEDAGYVRDTGKDRTGNLLDGRVGVFVGVMYQEYQLHGTPAHDAGAVPIVSGSSASVANRVSHVFDFRGPSMSVDTMCSSSLTAVHLACRSLESGDCDTAVAGGVNLSLHPNKYLLLSQGRLASSDGRCASFGAGGDGYAPGEGVGAILLKPLARAVADGDRIYGLIKGTAANHRGRTSGYSVPEPVGQAEVIGEALRRAGVNARDVSYIDANSVGTSLGDPIEIAGLCKAFEPYTDDRGFCAIGSVKSNIGHAESAAGIAAVTKVLLQLRHGRLAPSLHASTLNPHIDFEQTPFVVQRESAEWPAPVSRDGTRGAPPRVAGVSAFGAGGSNVHVVMAEYVPDSPPQPSPAGTDPRAVIPLSARTTKQLRARAEQLVEWLGRPENADLALADVAYTLQVGREAREERLGVVASSVPDLVERLGRFLADDFAGGGIVRGSVTGAARTLTLFASDSDLDVMIAAWAEKGKYEKLLELWVNGVPVSWRSLHGTGTPRRVALPAYPFAAERYSAFDGLPAAERAVSGGPAPLHPLAQVNTSDFTEQRFTSVVTGEERFLGERAARVVPGAAFLEMAVAASCLSSRAVVGPSAPVVLRDIVFTQPLDPGEGLREVHVGLRPQDDGDIGFRITSTPPGGEGGLDAVEHGEGVLFFADGAEETVLDLPALRRACGTSGPTDEPYDERHDAGGAAREPVYRAVRSVRTGPGQALVRLALPDPVRDTEDGLVLHPGLLDAAVQACSDVFGGSGWARARDGDGPAVVRAIEEVLVLDACTSSMWAWVRPGSQQDGHARVPGFDLDLADEQGRVRVRIGGLSIGRAASDREAPRAAEPDPAAETRETTSAAGTQARAGQPVLLSRQWRARPAPARRSGHSAAHTTVLLAGLPGLEPLLRGDDAAVFLLTSADETPDGRYTAYSRQVLGHLRSLARGATGRHHVQLVVPGTPDATLLGGLVAVLRTAGLENPAVTGQLVVLDRTDSPERAVSRIRENLGCPEEALVRYVEGRREVPVWAEYEAPTDPHTLPWKENGVYLVAGEAGEAGVLEHSVARQIAAQTENATVILVGRSLLGPESRETSGEQTTGGAVRHERADISSSSEADALVARILERHRGLDGVVLAAGSADGSLIADTPDRDFLDGLAARAAGVVNLDTATRSLPLDFFVTFSSPAGVDGGAGQVDGAAAHAFLDGYAPYRQDLVAGGERSGHSQSVIWRWRDEGLPETSDIGDFHRILRSEHHQVRVSAPPGGRTGGDTPVPTQRQFPALSTDGTDS